MGNHGPIKGQDTYTTSLPLLLFHGRIDPHAATIQGDHPQGVQPRCHMRCADVSRFPTSRDT
jgi:hypothetical protein